MSRVKTAAEQSLAVTVAATKGIADKLTGAAASDRGPIDVAIVLARLLPLADPGELDAEPYMPTEQDNGEAAQDPRHLGLMFACVVVVPKKFWAGLTATMAMQFALQLGAVRGFIEMVMNRYFSSASEMLQGMLEEVCARARRASLACVTVFSVPRRQRTRSKRCSASSGSRT